MEYFFIAVYVIIAFLVVLTVHEASHAFVAYLLGDPTAKMKGRVTLNPIKHLDLFGTIILLVTQKIGWGKPVPVNAANFKHPVRDSALTAFAGPLSNFLLAMLMALLWKYLQGIIPGFFIIQIQYIFRISLYIGIFNLLPFPPLDGSQIVGLFVPKKYYEYYRWYLGDGVKYFGAIILVDIFIINDLFGFSFFIAYSYYFMSVQEILCTKDPVHICMATVFLQPMV